MNQDFVTQLQLQLREAALREERRTPLAQRAVRARRGLPGPRPLAAALAIALLAVAVAIGTLQLRGEPEPVKPKVVRSFKVADNLLSLSGGFGAAWASDPVRGQVLRIDPETRKVTARIQLGGDVQVVAGAGAVWALYGDLLTAGAQDSVQVARIDPKANRVVARIPMRSPQGDNFAPLFLTADGDHVWVIGASGALRIDPATDARDRFVPYELGGDTVAEGERVWTMLPDDRLREFDARTGRRVDDVQLRVPQDDAHPVLGPPGSLLLAGPSSLTMVDRTSGATLWSTQFSGDIRTFSVDGENAWVYLARADDGPYRLIRIDAETGARTGELSLGDTAATDLARIADDLWIAEPGGAITVVR